MPVLDGRYVDWCIGVLVYWEEKVESEILKKWERK